MALPILNTPKFELNLPSTKKKYKYRPFLAKEEKVLLIAQEGGDEKEIINAIKDIINACVENINVEELPIFDLEYIFLKLREKSIGDVIKFYVSHHEGLNPKGELCDNKEEIEINLSEVKVIFDKNHSDKIQLDDTFGVCMKYPSLKFAQEFEASNMSDTETIFSMLKKSIDYIYDKETVYPTSEATEKELNDFVDSMTHSQMEKLNVFFDTMPKLKHEITWKCKKCGLTEKIVLEGLSNFFT